MIADKACAKVVKQHIHRILEKLENQGVRNVVVDHRLKRHDATLFQELESLGIRSVLCYCLPGTGEIHLSIEGRGGPVDERGSSVPEWIGTFLRDPTHQDVPSKLKRSGAAERHVCVLVAYGGAPWPVESYLEGALGHIP